MLAKLNFASNNGRKDTPNDFRLNIAFLPTYFKTQALAVIYPKPKA
jgi:hypothetical protein